MVRVKICGITNLGDALAAVRVGSDALGFLFYKKSPRYISPGKASRIIAKLPRRLIKIGVFVNARESQIRRIARLCKLDMLQFHGDESPEFCDKFKDYKVIKAIRIRSRRDLKNLSRYKTFAFLFDTFVKSRRGGTGEKFNWRLLMEIDQPERTIFLSGGLNAKNVRKAIEIVRPDWVDVSSSVELIRGKKDRRKLNDFIRAAKE